jgi:hypothetical protein
VDLNILLIIIILQIFEKARDSMNSRQIEQNSNRTQTSTQRNLLTTSGPQSESILVRARRGDKSRIILERIYQEVLDGKTLAKALGGILAQANQDVQKEVRDQLMFRATKEQNRGVYVLDLNKLAENLGFQSESHHRVKLMLIRNMPSEFQEILQDVLKLEEIGEELGEGRMPKILSEKNHWNTKHWHMVCALSIAAYEGSFKNCEISPLHYLIKRHGRDSLRDIITPVHLRQLASKLKIGLKKPRIKLTEDQKEFIQTFAGIESDSEIAKALRLPVSTVTNMRERMRVRKKEAVEIAQAAEQVRKQVLNVMQKIIAKDSSITDEKLTANLQRCGFPIARRTVTKYRNLLENADSTA